MAASGCGDSADDGQASTDATDATDVTDGTDLVDGTDAADGTDGTDGVDGDCEPACPAGETCEQGSCVSACAAGTTWCADACVDTQTDPAHCGDCGAPCAAGDSCVAGKCEAAGCAADQVLCGEDCVDPKTSATHCGASGDCQGDNAGFACSAGQACTDGVCALSCEDGQIACAEMCIDPQTSATHCGASGDCAGDLAGVECQAPNTCVAGACQCPAGQISCDGACVDPATNASFCGASGDCVGETAGSACGDEQSCVDGVCVCGGALEACGGACVDTSTNSAHCGKCDTPCGDGTQCVDGGCIAVTFNGALPETTGIWNYQNTIGPAGAAAMCEASFPGSKVCNDAMLLALSPTGQMAAATATDGLPVGTFWAPQPTKSGEELECTFDDPDFCSLTCDGWAHGTGDVGEGGVFRELNLNTGAVGELGVNSCTDMRSVGCCTVTE